jgi:undecaprenyl-diphosphatase
MIHYLLLGIVQGLTEFLPVSSSAHLVLFERFLGFDPPGVLLEAALHLGTLGAVLLLFRRDLVRLIRGLFHRGSERREVGRLIVGTIPIVLLGFFFQDRVEEAFTSLGIIGFCLLVTGTVLFFADRAGRRAKRREVRLLDSILIGLSQAMAVLPGISRSGATIATGLILGVRGKEAARFSFLLSIPAILGAGGLKIIQAFSEGTVPTGEWTGLLLGVLTAGLVGALAIKGLLAVIARGKLKVFGIYCLAVGLSVLIYSYLI